MDESWTSLGFGNFDMQIQQPSRPDYRAFASFSRLQTLSCFSARSVQKHFLKESHKKAAEQSLPCFSTLLMKWICCA